jgi:hypothetical protein
MTEATYTTPTPVTTATTAIATAATATTTAGSSSSSTLSPHVIDNMAIIKQRIENATEGLPSRCFNLLYNRVLPGPRGKENALTICDYITSMKSEINPSDRYKRYW